ncbi:KIF-binding protein-like [Odontomachus brunneus]|uniref:KIF-binding protein-like n=1 Tax=Odontomachus brunneus TaxID=486640 RepID=UPI0013F21C75|nr:KIF-binding protein-like [Odontomachus brunneus]
MFIKTTDESKCESVPTTGVVESSCSFEDTIKPSDEIMKLFKLTYTFPKDPSKISKRQIRTTEIKMNKLFHKVINSQDTTFVDIITLAYICEQICFTYMKLNQTENLSAARDSILCCLHLIKDKELDPKIILLTLKAYSHLSYIYHKQKKLENAIKILDNAVDLYLIYMKEHREYDIPIDYEDIIKPSEQIKNGYSKLKSLYRHILQTLIDVHTEMGSKTNESFMQSRHLLLMDELNSLQTFKEHIQWIEKAMIVCNYLIMYNRFGEVRNYFDEIFVVQKNTYAKYNDILGKKTFSEEYKLYEKCMVAFKLTSLCYAKYNVALLRQSVERQLRLEKNENSKTNNSTIKYPSKSKERASRRLLVFAPNEKAYFNTDTYYSAYLFADILNYNEAQKKFSDVLAEIYEPELHHTLVDVNYYVSFILYISKMYKYIAFYEKDTASQFLLRKRRAEILETAENFLGNKNDCKLLLWLQLTIAYSILIDMKVEDLEAAPLSYLPQRHDTLVDEINTLVESALIFLRKYKCYNLI